MNKNATKVLVVGTAMNLAAMSFITSWEGTKLKPYQDIGGVWTYCTGATQNVIPTKTYTATECAVILQEDLAVHGEGVLRCVTLDIGGYEMVALVSLAFNIGVARFCGSTLVRLLNMGQRKLAAEQFVAWSYVGKKWIKGLNKRRKAERALFLHAPAQPVFAPQVTTKEDL